MLLTKLTARFYFLLKYGFVCSAISNNSKLRGPFMMSSYGQVDLIDLTLGFVTHFQADLT